MSTKTCTVCMEEKPPVYFGFMNKASGTRKPRCKACLATLARKHRANSPQTKDSSLYHKAYKLKSRYGITIGHFDTLLKDQGGVCEICRTNEWGKRGPVVDHHHATHVIRAILCNRCNTALGLLKEDPEVLNRAATYILNHATTTPAGV